MSQTLSRVTTVASMWGRSGRGKRVPVRGRVLVAMFAFEANSFTRGETTLDDFRAHVYTVGPAATKVLSPNTSFGAGCRAIAEAGYQLVPSVAAGAIAGPVLSNSAVRQIVRKILAPCTHDIDGCFVALHGAAVAQDDEDPEGTLLSALREELEDRPLSISLDCHAHLTPAMVKAVDIVTAFRTCPHTDQARTGEQAGRLLVDALDGRAKPVCAMAERPMITPADSHNTAIDPYRHLMALCDSAEGHGALSAALLTVQPWLDVSGLGWKAVVTTDDDYGLAGALAEDIVDEAWAVRRALCSGVRPPIATALAVALKGPAPYVIADASDATNGGALGDSTELLRAALAGSTGKRILISILDPAAARAAYAAGEGATFMVTLGEGEPGAYNERLEVEARVEHLFDGTLRHTHPALQGTSAQTGPAAVICVGSIQIVVHSHRVLVIDPAIFEATGLDPATADVVQAKSHVSFRAGFGRVSERSIVAEGSGPSSGNLTSLPYQRRPRPLYPFEDA